MDIATQYRILDELSDARDERDDALAKLDLARRALEDICAGSDGWGMEIQIGAIDDARDLLGLQQWCAHCCCEGHRTYDHYRAKPVGGSIFLSREQVEAEKQ